MLKDLNLLCQSINSWNILIMIIAIDGPSASGKGTLARRLADHFHCAYLDTG
jgi:cytidylate kinase